MGQALPNDLDRLLGGGTPIRVSQPVDAGAVHCDGMVDIARLITFAPKRDRPRRSVLTDRSRG